MAVEWNENPPNASEDMYEHHLKIRDCPASHALLPEGASFGLESVNGLRIVKFGECSLFQESMWVCV